MSELQRAIGILICLAVIAWSLWALINPLGANRLRYGFWEEEKREHLALKYRWASRIGAIPLLLAASYFLVVVLKAGR